jgi:hypothetical protein
VLINKPLAFAPDIGASDVGNCLTGRGTMFVSSDGLSPAKVQQTAARANGLRFT